jgi:transposase
VRWYCGAAGLFKRSTILQSLPGAGSALAPRLLAASGSQRDRYGSAEVVQKHSGIAPVMEKSGKKKWVHFRWACPKFLRQSFHEWAGHSTSQSTWARAPTTSNSAAEAKTTTRLCAPWLSNGFASYFDAGKIE